jgi:hypothetical protein
MEKILLVETLSPSIANLTLVKNETGFVKNQQKLAEQADVANMLPHGKQTYLNGIFMQAGVRNGNKRVYPLTELQGAVIKLMNAVSVSGGVWGELDHPTENALTISLTNVSHAIVEMNLVGNDVYGKAMILNTPNGLTTKALMESGVLVGVSSRGKGFLNENREVYGFDFLTVDIVATPSAPDALPKPVYESVMEAKNAEEIQNVAEASVYDLAAQKYLKKEIMKFLKEGLLKKA